MAGLLGLDADAFIGAIRAGLPASHTYDLCGTVRELARRAGGSPTEAEIAAAAALRKRFTAAQLARVPRRTLVTLDRLRARGHVLGLVSNCTVETPRLFRQTAVASRLDTLVFSSELGVSKPDPTIYRAACDAVGVTSEAVVYVGDGADEELAGATAVGMQAIRTTEFANNHPGWVGPSISTIAQLIGHPCLR